jgi:hypothetical protein
MPTIILQLKVQRGVWLTSILQLNEHTIIGNYGCGDYECE